MSEVLHKITTHRRASQPRDRALPLEATSNLGNPDGGDTSITPNEFLGLIFGADHIGTLEKQSLLAETAIEKTRKTLAALDPYLFEETS